jgi:hypothetical protein
MKDLTTNDVRALKSIKTLIQSFKDISPEVQLYLYDNAYRPVNDLLSIHGYSKPDNGELS